MMTWNAHCFEACGNRTGDGSEARAVQARQEALLGQRRQAETSSLFVLLKVVRIIFESYVYILNYIVLYYTIFCLFIY